MSSDEEFNLTFEGRITSLCVPHGFTTHITEEWVKHLKKLHQGVSG